MALPKYTETRYRVWHYFYITICSCVFFFLIAPLFVIFPLSFNAEEFLSFSEGMKNLDPDAFSLRWYKDMIYGTKNPWGLAAKNSFIIAIFATLGSVLLGTVAALGLSSRHMPYKGLIMATLISPMIVPLIISGVAIFFFMAKAGLENTTIPIQMWTGVREQLSPTILAVATCLIILSTLILVTAELLRRRSERLRGINR